MPAPDLTRLAALLREREYTQHAREHVLAYAAATGTLEGCAYLEPEDRAGADARLEAAWPPVPPTSHAWDEDRRDGEPSRWTVAGGVALSPPELDVLPGEPDPFEPSAEDLADYAAWSATLPHGMA